jgi:hypothetical protein
MSTVEARSGDYLVPAWNRVQHSVPLVYDGPAKGVTPAGFR